MITDGSAKMRQNTEIKKIAPFYAIMEQYSLFRHG